VICNPLATSPANLGLLAAGVTKTSPLPRVARPDEAPDACRRMSRLERLGVWEPGLGQSNSCLLKTFRQE
jgi:hypothetical protein